MSFAVESVDGREVVWTAQPRQEVALCCPAVETCMAGGKGSGKTDAIVNAPVHQILYCAEQFEKTGRKQRGRWVTFRKQLKNLTDIIQRTQELYPVMDPVMGIDGWNKQEKRWTFSSGYVVDLAHLDGPDDHLGYNGQEMSGIGFDQVEDFPEEVYHFLAMQLRSKDEGMRKLLRIFTTLNPGGKYPHWVKRYFWEECKPHNTIKRQEVVLQDGRKRITTKALIPAYLRDNRYLFENGDYEARMMRLPDHLRKMYLDGDFDVVVGAHFASIWNAPVHVIKSFPISGAWPIKMGIDWGSTAPASCHWGTKDNDGNIYIIDEIYGPGVTGRTFGERIHKRFETQRWSAERKYTKDEVYGLIDRQARSGMGGDGRLANAAAGISSWGIRLFDANKDRAGRVEQWMERLIPDRKTGKPRVFIFGDRCPNLVRTLPALPTDPKNPDDIDHDIGESHAYDSAGFILMDWPLDTQPNDERKQGDKDVERWLALAKSRKEYQNSDDGGRTSTGYGD